MTVIKQKSSGIWENQSHEFGIIADPFHLAKRQPKQKRKKDETANFN